MKINEIFYSLQGEGYYIGTPAVFVRFSGCNLRCPFCDTSHNDGEDMSVDEIVKAVCQYPARHIVLTGGEPSLFVSHQLVQQLHEKHKFVAIETNGTRNIEANVDWITLSPKIGQTPNAELALNRCNELKIVFQNTEQVVECINSLKECSLLFPQHLFVQPCDMGSLDENKQIIDKCVAFCKSNPQWRLSLQIHKIIDIK